MTSRSLRDSRGVNEPRWGTHDDIFGWGDIDRPRVLRALAGLIGGLVVGVAIGFAGLGMVLTLLLLWLVATASVATYVLTGTRRRR
jgi:hypothetical protein